jgi:hypothetical protein
LPYVLMEVHSKINVTRVRLKATGCIRPGVAYWPPGGATTATSLLRCGKVTAEREEHPSAGAPQARAAPCRSRAARLKPMRSRACQDKTRQFRSQSTVPHPAKVSRGALSPAPAAPQSCPLGQAPPACKPCAEAREPREPVHTSQPFGGVCACLALRRPSLRRARKSRTGPQTHPGTRRTFHKPRGPPGATEH